MCPRPIPEQHPVLQQSLQSSHTPITPILYLILYGGTLGATLEIIVEVTDTPLLEVVLTELGDTKGMSTTAPWRHSYPGLEGGTSGATLRIVGATLGDSTGDVGDGIPIIGIMFASLWESFGVFGTLGTRAPASDISYSTKHQQPDPGRSTFLS